MTLPFVKEIHIPDREEQFDFFAKPWEKFDDEDLPLKPKVKALKDPGVDEITSEPKKSESDDKATGKN